MARWPKGLKRTDVAKVVEEPKEAPRDAAQEAVRPIEDILTGEWEMKRVDSNHTIYASFDAQNQFITIHGRKSGKTVKIKLKDAGVIEVNDIWPGKPESVKIMWPTRQIPIAWLYKKP